MSDSAAGQASPMEEADVLRRRLDILHRGDLVLNRTEELGLLLRRFLELIMEAAQVESGTLYLVEAEREQLVFAVVRGPAGVISAFEGRRMPLGQGIAGKCAVRGTPIWVPVVEHSRDWARDLAEGSGYRPNNVLCLPLKAQGRVIGVVQLFDHPVEHPYTQADLDFLGVLVNDLALKMENARLLDTTREMVDRLRALLDVGVRLGATLDRTELLALILEWVRRLLSAEATSIFELDEETGELFLCDTTRPPPGEDKEVRVPPGQGIAGWVAQHGKTVLVPDVQKDPRWHAKVDEVTSFFTRSMICTPLVVQEQLPGQEGLFRPRVIGVAQALNKEGDQPFSAEDQEIFEGLARQAALAIERERLYREMNELFISTFMALAEAMEAKDAYTRGHTRRVTELSEVIAEEMELSAGEVLEVRRAAMLHDIGKIGLPDKILQDDKPISDQDWQEIREHPHKGWRILEPFFHLRPSYHLRGVIRGVAEHHERYDGTGYPQGLRGEEISVAGRIIAVADTFDAMTSNRPYRQCLSVQAAVQEIRENAGRQFDPAVVDAFLHAWEKGAVVPPGTQPAAEGRSAPETTI